MNTIEEAICSSLPRKEALIVAFSGGGDSLALLIALQKLGFPVQAVYVNHHLRSDAELEKELNLNEENCRKLGLSLVVFDLDSKELASLKDQMGVEQSARMLRYQKLLEYCKACEASLVTAHNNDDQLETVLTRLFQGSSASHAYIERMSIIDGVKVYHPLLSFSHEQLLQYDREHGLLWAEDSTNSGNQYLRNKIRHTITPAVLDVFPQALQGVDRFCHRCEEFTFFVRDEAKKVLGKTVDGKLSRQDFLSCPPVARDEVLYQFFHRESRISYELVCRVRSALEKGQVKWKIVSSGCVISFNDGFVSISADIDAPSFCISVSDRLQSGYKLSLPSSLVFSIKDEGSFVDSTLLRIDGASLSCPVLRSAISTDEISLEGRTVRLSLLCNEWKIPKQKRNMLPVLEDRNGLVAVFGRCLGGKDRLCNRYKSLAPSNS
ncbi:MAG: tRNA lysidine(34) synthetase TilS, partial [Sphaerochaetaceae bacterium]